MIMNMNKENAYYLLHYGTELGGDSFLGIDLAMSHSLEGRVGDTAPVCRQSARLYFVYRERIFLEIS